MLRVAIAVLAASMTWAQAPERARTLVNRGLDTYRQARYSEAAALFRRAIGAEPQSVAARVYLALSLMNQYIPGCDEPENLRHAEEALLEFEWVLALDPQNEKAVECLAMLNYQMSVGDNRQYRLDKSQEWYERLIEIDPQNKEAFYSLGVILWSKWYPEWSETRKCSGMKPEDPGPLTNRAEADALRAKFGAGLQQAIRHLERALELDPEYDDAMAYLNLLIRERADLREDSAGYHSDIRIADKWLQRTLDTKKKKAQRPRSQK